ncbi:serine/threonine protein kinase [Ktedonobacteria bacterium brp13]|nr:serine/threonine protein kinase [Ktedonobacteria bacterium brp13]
MVPPQEQSQAVQNFRVEAKILWGLNHPNLPTLEYFFEEREHDRYFLVMEYIDGDTLENYLEHKRSPFPERRVLEWARQLCDVMLYLHSQRPPIIFRDMKPGNIMLSRRNGQIKLIDFGIARFFRPMNQQDTQILGTPGYAPPEQYGKAQTDERSDIYALGMTLFHLLTNKLSEQGFGLENVHRDYPRISPNVARALEKATSIKPDDRFQTVDEFRHALFDVGVFVFESGDIVATPDEMAHMCFNYPEEAAEYLYDGEIEAWLLDMGENELAEIAGRAVKVNKDPIKAIEQFVQAVAAQNMQNLQNIQNSILMRGNTPTNSVNVANANPARDARDGRDSTRHATPPAIVAHGNNGNNNHQPASPGRMRQTPKALPIIVSPRSLDFGTVFPGISAALIVKISGAQGAPVRGTIHSYEPWIQLSKTTFDGPLTEINVRVNSLRLQRNQRYTGEVVIVPEQDTRSPIIVNVEADVQGYIRNKRHPGRTHGADLDDYDADEFDSLSNIPVVATAALQQPSQRVILDDTLDRLLEPVASKQLLSPQVTPPALDPGRIDVLKNLHEPASSPRQERLLRLALAFACSFMTASLGYTFFAAHATSRPLVAPVLSHLGPQFILTLGIMIPAATLGALIILYERNWRSREVQNRAFTGMNGALLCVASCEFIWQLTLRTQTQGWVQLLFMLVVAALGATATICERPHRYIMSTLMRVQRAFGRSRWTVAPALVLGLGLGYFLTYGFAFSIFTVFGILLAMGIVAGLLWRAISTLRQKRQR